MAVSALYVAVSWDQWDPWVAEEVVRRRAYQGIPVRAGEVEFIQSLFPEGSAALVVFGVGLAVARRRLRGRQIGRAGGGLNGG